MKLSSMSARRGEQGVAVIVVLVLLTIVMLYIAANVRSLHIMGQEIKQMEQRQLRHWSSRTVAPAANAVPAAPVDARATP